jgi:hypothetical protein
LVSGSLVNGANVYINALGLPNRLRILQSNEPIYYQYYARRGLGLNLAGCEARCSFSSGTGAFQPFDAQRESAVFEILANSRDSA